MRQLEHSIAQAVMIWWAYWANAMKIDHRLLFSVPNGGHRQIGVAKKMKAEGTRKGIPDYCLAIPRHGYHGLFLELKAGGPGVERGRLSKDQQEVGEILTLQGYRWAVAYGTDEAINTIEKYLKPERKQNGN